MSWFCSFCQHACSKSGIINFYILQAVIQRPEYILSHKLNFSWLIRISDKSLLHLQNIFFFFSFWVKLLTILWAKCVRTVRNHIKHFEGVHRLPVNYLCSWITNITVFLLDGVIRGIISKLSSIAGPVESWKRMWNLAYALHWALTWIKFCKQWDGSTWTVLTPNRLRAS